LAVFDVVLLVVFDVVLLVVFDVVLLVVVLAVLAVFVTFVFARLAFALVAVLVLAASPQAMPSALRPRTAEKSTFFISEISPVFSKVKLA
jgi:hypothetical protein